jgi:hypothetical protein
VWVASDREGHVGGFVTAGVGPVPDEALREEFVPVEDVEGILRRLPKISTTRLLSAVKRPDDFVDLAERGVFVFDWADIHRSSVEAVKAYEAVAVPHHPIGVAELPGELVIVATALKFTELAFADWRQLQVCRYLKCSNWK